MDANKSCDCLCICPPSPALEERIIRTKQRLLEGVGMDDIDEVEFIDLRSYSLITGRPKRTRDHDFAHSHRKSPIVGNKRAVVLLVDFSDAPASTAKNHYENMLFSSGSYSTGSMRDYYREVSYNQLDVTGSVLGQGGPTSGWFRAPKPKSYYTDGNYGFNSYPNNAQKLVEDVIDLANPHVNFSSFDNDGDSFIEALIVICSGTGAEVSGNTSDFWSHKWNINTKTVDGVKVNRYFMAPEDGKVGVMAHELGHLLCGLPDLYDTDYSSRGTGRWDLMAGGSWNNGGITPAHPTAWCKLKCGWINPQVIFNSSQNVTIPPYVNNRAVVKVPIGSTSSKEYFLLSNRRKNGFDEHIPGEGLIIEHIDENKTNNRDEEHYLVDIEQADGQRDLNNNSNSGDNGDAYPSGGNNAFTNSTTPNSKTYSGTDSKVKVENIAKAGSNITAKVTSGNVSQYIYEKVLKTFSSPHSKNAWAYIDTIGWRKIGQQSTDGVTNVFDALVQARANDQKVSAKIDNNLIQIIYF